MQNITKETCRKHLVNYSKKITKHFKIYKFLTFIFLPIISVTYSYSTDIFNLKEAIVRHTKSILRLLPNTFSANLKQKGISKNTPTSSKINNTNERLNSTNNTIITNMPISIFYNKKAKYALMTLRKK